MTILPKIIINIMESKKNSKQNHPTNCTFTVRKSKSITTLSKEDLAYFSKHSTDNSPLLKVLQQVYTSD